MQGKLWISGKFDEDDEQGEERISGNSYFWISTQTPHLLQYSSISIHCSTDKSLFRLPHNRLTVLYRNVQHVISLVKRNSNCCEAQNVTFCSGMSTGYCNKPHLQQTENNKRIGFLGTAPHTDFSSLLSHCSTVSQWLPSWVLYI